MITKALADQLTNCTVFSTVKQEEDEAAWLAARTHGIGGSDVGAICGVSPFTSARQIYLKKTGQYPGDETGGEAARERMHFGHMLEPVVANEYALRNLEGTNYKLVDIDCTLSHKDFPWALANIDRLIVEVQEDGSEVPVCILECKTTSEYMNEEWESGEILLSYMYQLNWYLWILGLEKGAFACLVGGNKFYAYEVFRNDELLETEIIPKAKSFWYDNVCALKEPEMQATDTDFVNGLYTDVEKNSETFLDDDASNDLAATVFDCKAKIKELEKIMEAAQNGLKDKLQDTEIGYCRDYTIKWSPRSQRRVDGDKLKSKYPEVYQDCLKTISFRAFSVKGA